jgi:hypothetical protein
MNIYIMCIVGILLNSVITAQSAPVEGPYALFGISGLGGVDTVKGAAPDQVEMRQWNARLLFPIKALDDRLLLVPHAKVWKWQHHYQELNGNKSIDDRAVWNRGLVAIYDDGYDFAPIIALSNYRALGVKNELEDMHEYVVGIDGTKWLNDFHPLTWGEFTSKLFYRIRHFPGHKRYLLALDIDLETKDGWVYSLALPSHFNMGHWDQARHRYFGWGIEAEGRTSPDRLGDLNGWVDGYQLIATVVARYLIKAPFYLELRSGIFMDSVEFYDHQGETKLEYLSDYAPYVQLKLTTYFEQN